MGQAVIVSEDARSYIDDPAMLDTLKSIIYVGGDYRDVWIGSQAPGTNTKNNELISLSNGNLINYLYYLHFVEDFMEPGRSVLDIGCGCGARTSMLGRYSSRAVGVESVPEVVAFASKHNSAPNVEYVLGSFPDAFLGGPFDYAFAVEVIEHVPHEKQSEFIRKALGELVPGGLLFITTPANEDTCGAPHVGLWTESQFGAILSEFSRRIVHLSHLDRQAGWEEGNARSNKITATHHRMVIQA